MRSGYLAPFLVEAAPWVAMMDAPQATVACDEQGQLVFANRAMLELLDVEASALLGLGWAKLLLDRDADEPKVRALVAAPGATVHRQTLASDGQPRHLELTCSAIAFGTSARGNSVEGLLGVAVEVPAELGHGAGGERSYERLVEDAPDLWARFDSDGRMLFASGSVRRLTGLAPAAFLQDRTLFERVLHPDYVASWREALARAASGDSRTFDVVVVHTNGTQVILQQTLYPVAGGLIEGAARDITAVRQLEALKAKNEERAMLDRLKSQLLSNVSHELRTPLVSIKGYVDLLLRGALGPVNPRQRRGLEIAGANTDRLIELIETLLDFADRQEERLFLHRRRFDLRDAVNDALGALDARIRSRGLRVEVALGSEPLEVFGDRARLAQVMRSILGNAEKFIPVSGGSIGSAQPDISVCVEVTAATVAVSVRDRGIGIPKSAQRRIFDRFYQVDSSSTRQFGGAGLGLAMAKELVTVHGGQILVESAEGQGSLFTVRLPLAGDTGRSHRSAERAIVLVAAEPALWPELREAVSALPVDLLFSDHEPSDTAAESIDGPVLLRRARRHRPDLVVVVLPSPAEAVAELRRDPDTSATPIIVVAARDLGVHEQPALTRADLVLAAPEAGQDWSQLAEALRRLLGLQPLHVPASRQVVVVEDEVEILDFMRFLLEKEGYDVVGVQSGKEALDQVTKMTGLVILDIALDGGGDGLDGIEVCRALKAALGPVPVLITTAMSGDDVRKISMAAGADGYLVKPFGVDEFLRHVRAHLAPNSIPPTTDQSS